MQRRHDPTYYFATRRLPRRGPAGHARALRLRAHGRRDRRRPAPPADARRRAARRWTPGRPSCERAARRRSRIRSSARWSTPPAATTCRSASCAPTCARCASTARPVRIASWEELVRLHGRLGRLGRADHGRRCSACPARHHADFGRLGARVPARELHPRRRARTGGWTASTSRRGPRALRRQRGRPGRDGAARAARAGRPRGRARARAVRRRRARRSPPRPRPCARACGSRARSTCGMLDRVEAIGFDVLGAPRRACASGELPRRGAAEALRR